MRTIKFRGKRVNDREWVFGQLWMYKDDTRIFNSTIDTGVIPETVGQFTTLKDDEENDIFEGDVIDVKRYIGTRLWNHFKGVVTFGEYMSDFGHDGEEVNLGWFIQVKEHLVNEGSKSIPFNVSLMGWKSIDDCYNEHGAITVLGTIHDEK